MTGESTKLVTSSGKPKPPRAGMGRPKGSTNKQTRELKKMILGALDDVGGQAYLAEQARENPTTFLTLIGKVLPMTVNGDDKGGPVRISIGWDAD